MERGHGMIPRSAGYDVGPLAGLRIVEFAGIGPGPFCGMMLADHGAEVLSLHRPGTGFRPHDPLGRGRTLVHADLKTADGVERARALLADADGLIEGFRPGVMERLGLGPERVCADNPRLVYGRMTGWGQDGPLASAPGHDINYIALAGVLHACGRAGDKPTPPLNLLGDFGGGGMLLAFGMCAALLQAQRTGQGQVVDCAIVDGSALMMGLIWGLKSDAGWRDERGVNLLDTGAPFYDTYACSDGRHVAAGALEPAFYAALLRTLELERDPLFCAQMDQAAWPGMKARLAQVFATRTRDDWIARAPDDACLSPVLSMEEAADHPHNRARGTFLETGGATEPARAPRFRPAKPMEASRPGPSSS